MIKGRTICRSLLVPTHYTSLLSTETYVLYAGSQIFLWEGSKSNKFCSSVALDIANTIKNKEKGGSAEIIFLKEWEANKLNNMEQKQYNSLKNLLKSSKDEFIKKREEFFQKFTHKNEKDFWKILGGIPAEFSDHPIGDKVFYKKFDNDVRLYEITSSKRALEKLKDIPLNNTQPDKNMLKSESCYIYVGSNEVYSWTGKYY
jgi:hypothetical protein